MAELDHDLLKKTAGLLAEIDRVAAAPSVAERVNRVIESAAPDLRYDTYDSFEAWSWHKSGYGDRVDDPKRLEAERHAPEPCGCTQVEVTLINEIGQERDAMVLECSAATPPREEPIYWISAPYTQHGLPHSVQKACGAEGCACSDLWGPPPKPPRIEWKRRGQEGSFTFFDEISEGTDLHDRVQSLYLGHMSPITRERASRLLLDISTVD